MNVTQSEMESYFIWEVLSQKATSPGTPCTLMHNEICRPADQSVKQSSPVAVSSVGPHTYVVWDEQMEKEYFQQMHQKGDPGQARRRSVCLLLSTLLLKQRISARHIIIFSYDFRLLGMLNLTLPLHTYIHS